MKQSNIIILNGDKGNCNNEILLAKGEFRELLLLKNGGAFLCLGMLMGRKMVAREAGSKV
jgi:hypothetical protein